MYQLSQKLGLGKSDYLKTVEAAVSSGVDAITAINTVRAMAIDVETQMPILSNKIGGLSGTPIKPIALRCVYEIASKFDIPIMGLVEFLVGKMQLNLSWQVHV